MQKYELNTVGNCPFFSLSPGHIHTVFCRYNPTFLIINIWRYTFRVLKTYVWSTLTYGCECWTIISDIEKKIEAAEMWFIRRMLRISWAEKKTNVNVLREGNVQRSLLKTIRKANGIFRTCV